MSATSSAGFPITAALALAARYGFVLVILWISSIALGSRSSGLEVEQIISLETYV